MCYTLLDHHRRLVYAYDELQNLSGTAVSSPEVMFGADIDGKPNVQLDAKGSDIILKKCYRNPRPVLVTAHALGFGIYRQPGEGEDTGLVRMFDKPQLWQDIGYRVRAGDLRDGAEVTLARTPDTSPEFLEAHSGISDLLQFVRCDSEAEQSEWVATAIRKNLERDELRPDDIVVINPDPLMARNGTRSDLRAPDGLRHQLPFCRHLHECGRKCGRLPRGNFPLGEIHRHSPGQGERGRHGLCHQCPCLSRNGPPPGERPQWSVRRHRAQQGVGAGVGVGAGMKAIEAEYESVRDRNFELRFTCPTEEQRERLRPAHGDMTEGGRDRLQKRGRDLDDLINDLASGRVRREDLGAGKLEALKSLIG